MPLTGVDDQGAFIDTGNATLPAIRPPAALQTYIVAQVRDTGSAVTPTLRPTRKMPGSQR